MSDDEEQIILVDAQDNVLGYKPYSTKSHDDNACWRIVSVWIENDQGQVLLQQRALDKAISPGKWTPAAEGTVSKGTSYDETAARELAEEVGLTGIPLIKKNKVYGKFEIGWRQVQGYVGQCNWPIEKFTPQLEEVEKLEWVDKQQILDEILGKKSHTRLWPDTCVYWQKWFNL